MLGKISRRFVATAASSVLIFIGALPAAPSFAAPAEESTQCTVDRTQGNLTDGSLNWGVRQSFQRYISGPVARGHWNLEGATYDGGSKSFQFPIIGGNFNAESGTVNARFSGKVHFQGHKSKKGEGYSLDLSVANPSVTADVTSGKGVLSGHVISRTFVDMSSLGEIVDYGVVPIGDITLESLADSEGRVTLNSTKVVLKEEGVAAFGGFYDAGEKLDNIAFNLAVTYPETCPEPPGSEDPEPEPSVEPEPSEEPAPPAEPEPSVEPDPSVKPEPSEEPEPENSDPHFDSKGCPAPVIEHKLETEALPEPSLDWDFVSLFRAHAEAEGFIMNVTDGYPSADNVTFNRKADFSVIGSDIQAMWPGRINFSKNGEVAFSIGKPRILLHQDGNHEYFLTIHEKNGEEREYRVATFKAPIYFDDSLGFFGALRFEKAQLIPDPSVVGRLPGFGASSNLPPLSARLDVFERFEHKVANGRTFFQSVWDASNNCGKLAWLNHRAEVQAPPAPDNNGEVYEPYQMSVEEENAAWDETSPGSAAQNTLRWGIKKSWRSYSAGSLVSKENVEITNDTYVFSGGQLLPDDGSGVKVIQYQGRLHYVKYGGILNIALSHPQVRVDSDGNAVLWMQREFAEPDGTISTDPQDQPYFFPAVKLGKATVTKNGRLSVVDSPTYLTQDMANVFIYAYREGLRMSDLSFEGPAGEDAKDTDTPDQNGEQTEVEEKDETPSTAAQTQSLQLLGANGKVTNTVRPGENVTIKAIGFADGPVRLELHSRTVELGEATSTNHLAVLETRIPATLARGIHELHAYQGELHQKMTVLVTANENGIFDISDLGPKPSQPGDKPLPRPKPGSDTCKADANTYALSGGSFTWALKDSWISYMNKQVFEPRTTASDGATFNGRTYSFSRAGGSYDANTGRGTINFAGTLHFQSHPYDGPGGYELDMVLANPTLTFNGSSGQIVAYLKSRHIDTHEMQNFGRVVIANFTSKPTLSGETLRLSAASTTANAEGMKAFGGFYEAGTPLAGFSAEVQAAAGQCGDDSAKPAPVEAEETTQPSVSFVVAATGKWAESVKPGEKIRILAKNFPDGPVKFALHSDPIQLGIATSANGLATLETALPIKINDGLHTIVATQGELKASASIKIGADQAKQESPKETVPNVKKQCSADKNVRAVKGGQLAWGVRQSFTTYIRGLAKGGWTTTAGAAWNGSTFAFPAVSGQYNLATKQGTINYSGTIHFTGHKGVLDLTLSNPSLVINGNQAALYLTANSTDMSGKPVPVGRVHFANVAISSIDASPNGLNLNAGSVTLTAAGAKGFAGFYKTGEALSGITSTVNLVAGQKCDANGNLQVLGSDGSWHSGSSPLAATGSDLTVALTIALVLIASGGLFLGARRRV